MGKGQQGKASKQASTGGGYCSLDRIQNHPGVSPLGMSAEFPDKMHPDCGQHHSMGCGPGQNKSEEMS